MKKITNEELSRCAACIDKRCREKKQKIKDVCVWIGGGMIAIPCFFGLCYVLYKVISTGLYGLIFLSIIAWMFVSAGLISYSENKE
jgi:hypothetical protein